MQIEKMEVSNRNRSWFRKLFFPIALEQTFSFLETGKVTYDSDVRMFIDEHLRPRRQWLMEHDPRGQINYQIITGPDHRIGQVLLIIEFTKPKLVSLFKLRWG